MNNSRFTWDENKHKENIKKHGFTFLEALTVFDDNNALYDYDDEHSQDEDRFIIIGLSVHANLLMVCHCFREDGEIIRIISAREATRHEAKKYGGA